MKTQLLKVNEDSIALGAKLIREGELVGFPTETVYGLGANALDAEAVVKIFEAKGRPQDNPLITHVSCVEEIPPLVRAIPAAAKKLMDFGWRRLSGRRGIQCHRCDGRRAGHSASGRNHPGDGGTRAGARPRG